MTEDARSRRWRDVSDALAAEIRDGVAEIGRKLPTEADLMARFGVGRHSVRRAMAELSERGLVRVEQGRGAYVHRSEPISYRLSEKTRFSRNLLDEGREPEGRTISDEEIAAPALVAEALRLPEGAPVHHLVQLGFADDAPLNYTHCYHPAARFPEFRERKRARLTATAIYESYGVRDYSRLKTVIGARLPSREEASALAQPASLPVIVMRKIDVDPDGAPIGYSESVWASERVVFSIDNTEQLLGARGGKRPGAGR